MRKPDHAEYVAAWMERAAKDASVTSLLLMFEGAWSSLCRRAESAVGQVVLESISELVLSKSVEQHRFLSPLKLEGNGVSSKLISKSAGAMEKRELQEGLCFMLAELLTVIGDLTDQVLTPGLYDELSRITLGSTTQSDPLPPNPPARQATPKKKEEETSMTTESYLVPTGIRNLDAIMDGGFLRGSSTAIVGPPGSGKTILAQQIAFHNATPERPVLYFSTLSEPGAKTLFYLNKLSFCDPQKINNCIHFVDLGVLLRTKGLQQAIKIFVERIKEVKPALIVVDSFRVFEDLASSPEELRKFSYELVVNIMTRPGR